MLEPYFRPDCIECGVDEAGRGALAGPVVAAAVIWDINETHDLVNEIRDSKKLSAQKRKLLSDFIKENAVAWSVGFVDNKVIDEVNILQATYNAMHDCIDQIVVTNGKLDHIIVDGNRFKTHGDVEHTCVVKGDDKYISIAAASILAKVARDEYMSELAKFHPKFGWDKNMGYGTKQHRDAIKLHGMCPYHRASFKVT